MVVLLMRLQRCENPQSLRVAAEPLREWVGDADKAGLASAFAAWITHVRLPELGVADALRSDTPEEVLEMLETERRTWADRIREKGHAEGLKRGRAGLGVGAETAASAGAGPIRKGPGAKLGLSPGGSHGREQAGRDRRVAARLR